MYNGCLWENISLQVWVEFSVKRAARNNPHKQPMIKLLYSEIVDNFDIIQTKYEVTEHSVYALYWIQGGAIITDETNGEVSI